MFYTEFHCLTGCVSITVSTSHHTVRRGGVSTSSSGALTSRSLVLPEVSVGTSGSTTVSGKGSSGDPAPAITGLHGASPVLMESMSKLLQA